MVKCGIRKLINALTEPHYNIQLIEGNSPPKTSGEKCKKHRNWFTRSTFKIEVGEGWLDKYFDKGNLKNFPIGQGYVKTHTELEEKYGLYLFKVLSITGSAAQIKNFRPKWIVLHQELYWETGYISTGMNKNQTIRRHLKYVNNYLK